MNKWLDNIYKYSIWIILVLSLLAYVAYYTLTFDGTLQAALTDWRTWVHIAFRDIFKYHNGYRCI